MPRTAPLTAAAAALCLATAAAASEPITLSAMGSFHVGGRFAEISGQPVRDVVFTPGGVPARVDPNGQYLIESMYVQFHIPAPQRGRFPLLMWHGGGLSGVSWETTPDGREGFQHWFLRRGWPVHVSDAVERGRSGFPPPQLIRGEPLFLTVDNPFERFRIGAGAGSWNADAAQRRVLAGNQFPHETEAYMNFMRQIVPRWTTTDAAINAAYTALIDRVGEAVVMVHSQAGQFGWRAAQARPGKVKALVLLEPAGVGDSAMMEALRGLPVLLVYGDHIAEDARWPTIRRTGIAFAERAREAGADVTVIDLPERGIRGNSHMLMMDRNNGEVAAVIQAWLESKGLWR